MTRRVILSLFGVVAIIAAITMGKVHFGGLKVRIQNESGSNIYAYASVDKLCDSDEATLIPNNRSIVIPVGRVEQPEGNLLIYLRSSSESAFKSYFIQYRAFYTRGTKKVHVNGLQNSSKDFPNVVLEPSVRGKERIARMKQFEC
jgi:hypothetical protein